MSRTKKRPAARSKKRVCKQCLSRPEKVRGVCGSCYVIVRNAINAGEITEEDAVAGGLLEPKRRAGPPRAAIRKKIEAIRSQKAKKK